MQEAERRWIQQEARDEAYALGQRLEAAFAGYRGAGAAFRFIGLIQVFQRRQRFCRLNFRAQVGGHLPLFFNRRDNRIAAFIHISQQSRHRENLANLVFVQRAGNFLAVARNKWQCIARVQEFERGRDLRRRYMQLLGNLLIVLGHDSNIPVM